ncbi:MAG TPA: hypothetical protein VNT81_04395, partial [Vicinamibacterales bacterium]|nr:hypothetical protein [Vicinamibacterales bacterium]
MKCPKCGYLGFETTDRCRNCQYDFSLAPFSTEPELTLHGADRRTESNDFELPPIKRQTDSLSATALDLDRLFGAPETKPEPTMPAPPVRTPRRTDTAPALSEVHEAPSSGGANLPPPAPAFDEPANDLVEAQMSSYEPPAAAAEPELSLASESEPEPAMAMTADVETPEAPAVGRRTPVADASTLPFDDAPLVP